VYLTFQFVQYNGKSLGVLVHLRLKPEALLLPLLGTLLDLIQPPRHVGLGWYGLLALLPNRQPTSYSSDVGALRMVWVWVRAKVKVRRALNGHSGRLSLGMCRGRLPVGRRKTMSRLSFIHVGVVRGVVKRPAREALLA
jgi:hypothetical protein